MCSRNAKIATKCGRAQKEQRRPKGSCRGKNQEPDGQVENIPTVSQETPLVEKKEKRKKEVSLVTAENIENLNSRFTIDTLTKDVNLLHLFSLQCHYEDCKDCFCSEHGTFRAVSPDCHENLEKEDMFMPFIEDLAPINFLCIKCLEKSGLEGQLFGRKSSLKHIREDIRVNEIIVCEEHLRTKIIDRIKESEEVHVV